LFLASHFAQKVLHHLFGILYAHNIIGVDVSTCVVVEIKRVGGLKQYSLLIELLCNIHIAHDMLSLPDSDSDSDLFLFPLYGIASSYLYVRYAVSKISSVAQASRMRMRCL
jgi:hypothetical protein